jgi:zinc transport system ATP-binding protein
MVTPAAGGERSAALVYQRVSFAYADPEGREPRSALENVSLAVAHGECLGILGPNGGGKSTLLKLTLGVLGGHTGEIRVLGLPPAEACRRRLIGYVPQRVEAELGFPLSVDQVVGLSASLRAPAWRGMSKPERASARESLDLVGAADLADRPVGRLSGGQLQRVMIARALAAKPKVLLLDEPTVGIDVAGQQQFARLLGGLRAALGLTIVVVSHDIRTVVAGCDRIACLSRTLHFHDAPSGLTPAVLAEVFRHDVVAIYGDVHVDAHTAAACTDPTHHHHPAPRARGGETGTHGSEGPGFGQRGA